MRRVRSLIVSLFVIAGAMAPAAVHAGPGPGGGAPPPPCSQTPSSNSFGDLDATEFTHYTIATAPDATQVGANDQQFEGLNWDFGLNNAQPAAVSAPTISVNSGLPASVFSQSQLRPAAFPISCALPSLNGVSFMSAFAGQLQEISTPSAYTPTGFTLGYSSARDVSPVMIPAGGGQQTVVARISLADPRYADQRNVHLSVHIQGAVVAANGPGPLTGGEALSGGDGTPGGVFWQLDMPVLNHEYDFSATISVPNGGSPIPHRPHVDFAVVLNTNVANACPGSDMRACIADPTLDGAQPGSGLATYAVGEAGHTWLLQHADWYSAAYPEQMPPPGPQQDLLAREDQQLNGSQPPTVNSTASDFRFTGNRTWTRYINNNSPQSVTNPTITTATGVPAGDLLVGGHPVTALPIVYSQPSLGAGQQLQATPLLGPGVPVQFSPGYDSTTSVTPPTVPVGGGQQTVTLTVTPIDPAIDAFNIGFFDNLGSTLVSSAAPTNLDQGERICGSFGGLVSWTLCRARTGKAYTFTAVIQVPNPFDVPFQHRPGTSAFGDNMVPVSCSPCSGRSVTVADPTLDGSVPGSGQITWTVDESTHNWSVNRQVQRVVRYMPTAYSQLVALGPPVAPLADQSVHATLSIFGIPARAGREITFSAGASSCTAATGSDGVATCVLSPALGTGQYTLHASFAGDISLYPASASAPLVVYQPTRFAIWGGNAGGVSVGTDYNFWGAGWAGQVTGGDYQANASFKGYADSVSGNTWTASPGASSRPPDSVASYIGVLVATSAARDGGSITGTYSGIVILRVDDPSTYAPDPGHPANGVMVLRVS